MEIKLEDKVPESSAWSDRTSIERMSLLAARRNETLTRKFNEREQNSESYENECEYLKLRTNIPEEFRAYHSGPLNQIVLNSTERPFLGYRRHNHVYFSLSLREVLRDYVLPEGCRKNGLYVIDLRKTKGARVQTSYSYETLWNDDIRSLINFYENPRFLDTVLANTSGETRYLLQYKHASKEKILEEIKKRIDKWINRFTIPFKIKNIERYKTKNQTFILVPAPIKVSYQ